MSNTTALTAELHAGFVASSSVEVLGCVSCVPPGLPQQVIVPDEQLYYWSPEWQNAEHEAMGELRKGLGIQFDDPTEAIRWLLSDDG